MGMYDTFGHNGDQLKIFDIPCYYFDQSAYNKYKEDGTEYKFLGYMGGSFSYFNIGDPVPWRGLSYNYSPNFTVVDVGNEEYPTMLFGFTNGKLLSVIEYNEEKFHDYEYLFGGDRTVINGYGTQLRLRTVYQLRDFVAATIEADQNRIEVIKELRPIRQCIYDYCSLVKGDNNKSKDCIDAIDTLREIQSKMLKEVFRYTNYFYKREPHGVDNVYGEYGGYLEAVHHYTDCDNPVELFPALIHEANKYIKDNEVTLEKFFAWNDTPDKDKEWITKVDNMIRNYE